MAVIVGATDHDQSIVNHACVNVSFLAHTRRDLLDLSQDCKKRLCDIDKEYYSVCGSHSALNVVGQLLSAITLETIYFRLN